MFCLFLLAELIFPVALHHVLILFPIPLHFPAKTSFFQFPLCIPNFWIFPQCLIIRGNTISRHISCLVSYGEVTDASGLVSGWWRNHLASVIRERIKGDAMQLQSSTPADADSQIGLRDELEVMWGNGTSLDSIDLSHQRRISSFDSIKQQNDLITLAKVTSLPQPYPKPELMNSLHKPSSVGDDQVDLNSFGNVLSSDYKHISLLPSIQRCQRLSGNDVVDVAFTNTCQGSLQRLYRNLLKTGGSQKSSSDIFGRNTVAASRSESWVRWTWMNRQVAQTRLGPSKEGVHIRRGIHIPTLFHVIASTHLWRKW